MGDRTFVLWKLAYIALCKFSPFWLRFSPFCGDFFKDLLVWLIIGWQVCILGSVSDKYSYLLKPCCNYIFQVSFLSISTKVTEGNGNLCIFLKHHYPCSGNLRKNQILIYPRTMNVLSCKESKFANLLYLLVASLYDIRSKLKICIHSFISCRLPCPNEWFKVELFWRKYNEKLHFWI